MNEHASNLMQNVQQAASSKSAIVAGVTGASVGTWIEKIVTDPLFQNSMILIGAMVPITIILINVSRLIGDWQTKDERRAIASAELKLKQEEEYQARLRTALLEKQAEEKGVSVDFTGPDTP